MPYDYLSSDEVFIAMTAAIFVSRVAVSIIQYTIEEILPFCVQLTALIGDIWLLTVVWII
jgi:hypothetical protein